MSPGEAGRRLGLSSPAELNAEERAVAPLLAPYVQAAAEAERLEREKRASENEAA